MFCFVLFFWLKCISCTVYEYTVEQKCPVYSILFQKFNGTTNAKEKFNSQPVGGLEIIMVINKSKNNTPLKSVHIEWEYGNTDKFKSEIFLFDEFSNTTLIQIFDQKMNKLLNRINRLRVKKKKKNFYPPPHTHIHKRILINYNVEEIFTVMKSIQKVKRIYCTQIGKCFHIKFPH